LLKTLVMIYFLESFYIMCKFIVNQNFHAKYISVIFLFSLNKHFVSMFSCFLVTFSYHNTHLNGCNILGFLLWSYECFISVINTFHHFVKKLISMFMYTFYYTDKVVWPVCWCLGLVSACLCISREFFCLFLVVCKFG